MVTNTGLKKASKVMKFLLLVAFIMGSQSHTDNMLIDYLHAGETKTKTVDVPAGPITIDTFATDDKLITCQYANAEGLLGLSLEKTHHCVGNIDGNKPQKITISVKNEEKDDIEFRIHTHN